MRFNYAFWKALNERGITSMSKVYCAEILDDLPSSPRIEYLKDISETASGDGDGETPRAEADDDDDDNGTHGGKEEGATGAEEERGGAGAGTGDGQWRATV